MNHRAILCVCLGVFSFLLSSAQPMSVTRLPLNNSLPSRSVIRVHCDREGFMWLGTRDGLCRYDGYRTLVFRSGLQTPHLLTNNEITCIAENRDGYLFIGTKKGINVLNKRNYQITPVEQKDLKDQEIRTMTVDHDGWLWVGTLTSVFRCSADFSFCKRYDDSLPITSVNSIYEDADHDLWVTLWEQGLHKYDPASDRFVAFPKVGKNNNPFQIFQDDKKQHWILTWGDGVYLFYPHEKDKLMLTRVDMKKEDKWQENGCFSITQDDKYGYIWIVSTQGLYALQKRPADEVTEVDISSITSKLNNIFSEIVKDKDGNLWIASFNEGVSVIDLNMPPVQNYAFASIRRKTGLSTNIKNIYEDKDGDWWMVQNRWGIGLLRKGTTEPLFYTDVPSLKNQAKLKNISCITEEPSLGEVWLGAEYYPEIFRFKKEGESIRQVGTIELDDASEHRGFPRLFFHDSRHNLWIATTKGLRVRSAKDGKIRDVQLPLADISGIAEGKDSALWIATSTHGVYRIGRSPDLMVRKEQMKNLTVQSAGLPSDNIDALCVDSTGTVWMGSQDGRIFTCDSSGKSIQDLSEVFSRIEEGIYNILSDAQGYIWISTNKRVLEYDPKNGGMMDHSATGDVAMNSFMANSCCESRSGRMLYGGSNGIVAFTSSSQLSDEPRRIRTWVADVKVDGQSALLSKGNRRFNLRSQEIRLKPGDKNIEIDFSSLNYTFSHKIGYAYKMSGVDDDWVYVGNERQFAFYNQLPKGKHTLYLKTTDVNGLWSNYYAEIRVYKQPAFYETWWAYALYVLLGLLCVALAYRWTKRRIQLRNDLRIAQIEKEKSEELTQTKLRYFTNISHDLLTPLTVITCLIDDVEMTVNSRIPQLGMIRANVNKLKGLLQQILDFRRMESGSMQLAVSKGEVTSFVEEICRTNFLPLMKKKHLAFAFHAECGALEAYFDRDKLDKILSNLLSNACKYTGENGTITLTLTSCRKESHCYLQLKVADTGEGIAPGDLKNIFKRFYTANKNEEGKSNGIGLSLTKELVELHQGRIGVESTLGKGTAFTVELPIDKESYAETDLIPEVGLMDGPSCLVQSDSEATVQETEEAENAADYNLLVVEDNEDLLALMKKLLSRHYRVFTATNGLEALEVVRNNEVDIIVSDVMMPEMDGLELCRKLKSDLETSHIPVILLTAKSTTEDRIECYEAGADGYISKPFELKMLEARILNFVSHKRKRQDAFRSEAEVETDTLEISLIDKEFLDKVIAIINSHLSDGDFGVEQLADEIALSKSSLYRKLKVITGLSPVDFLRNIRLKYGAQLLKTTTKSVAEVSEACGFSTTKYFSKVFKSEFGVAPKDWHKAPSE